MKKFGIAVLAVLLIAAFALPASAYDNLITNDTSMITAPMGMKLGVGVATLMASEGWDKDSETYDLADDLSTLYIPIKFRYGAMDNLEIFGVLSAMEMWDMGDFGDESGVGDLYVGAKYGLMPDGLATLRGTVIVPIGDDAKGLGNEGGVGVDVGIMSTYWMEAIGLNGQAGLRYAVEDGDTKMQPGLGIYLDGEACYMLSDMFMIQGGAEIMMTGDGKWDGNDVKDSASNLIELGIGATYMATESIGIRGDFLYDVAGKMMDKNMGVLVGLCYTIR